MQNNNSRLPKKYCVQCSAKLEDRLIEKLSLGKEVFCESCGHQFDVPNNVNLKQASEPDKKKKQTRQYPPKSQPHPPHHTPIPPVIPPSTPKQSDNQNISSYKPQKPTQINYTQYSPSTYDPSSVQGAIVDVIAYQENLRRNRRAYKSMQKQNKRAFKKPSKRDKKKFKELVKYNKDLFKNASKENKRIFKITKLSNLNTDLITQKRIAQEYKSIVKENKKKHKKAMKAIKKGYKKSFKINRKIFKQTRTQNTKAYTQVSRINKKEYYQAFKYGNQDVNYMQKFNPIEFEITKFIPYNPGDTAKPPELKKIHTQHTKFDPFTGKPVIKKARFDPMTGQPLDPNSSFIPPVASALNNNEKQSSSATEDSPKFTIKLEVEEVFTVLEPEIRQRLFEIPISKEERNLLAKSFIYLNDEQQSKYLEELENINGLNPKEYEEFVNQIRALKKIPNYQREFLIEQLHYIPDKKHREFVETLEASERDLEADTLEEQTVQNNDDQEIPKEKIKKNDLSPEEKALEQDQQKQIEADQEKIKALEQEKQKIEQEKMEVATLEREKRELERRVRVKNLKEDLSKKKQAPKKKSAVKSKSKSNSKTSKTQESEK